MGRDHDVARFDRVVERFDHPDAVVLESIYDLRVVNKLADDRQVVSERLVHSELDRVLDAEASSESFRNSYTHGKYSVSRIPENVEADSARGGGTGISGTARQVSVDRLRGRLRCG